MPVDREFVFEAVADERLQIAALIDGLDDAQLATPSLCEGWSVKTVAAHIVSVFADGFWTFQLTALRRGGISRAIDELARRRAQQPAAEIADTLRRRAHHRLSPPVTGPMSGLTDILAHDGDIKIPLGVAYEPAPERIAPALEFLTGPKAYGFLPRSRLKGLRLHATDIEQSWGRGDEVRGPAASLLMSVLGRRPLLSTLDGPGLPTLRQRIGA
ncbi:hypothetical protein A5698_21365 [Mycobacterium sp. E136]|nr:hypothetical protein A5698_21365 [Mycobacterium sp. E136]